MSPLPKRQFNENEQGYKKLPSLQAAFEAQVSGWLLLETVNGYHQVTRIQMIEAESETVYLLNIRMQGLPLLMELDSSDAEISQVWAVPESEYLKYFNE